MQWLLNVIGGAAVGTVVKFYTELHLKRFEEHRTGKPLMQVFVALPRWKRLVVFLAFVMVAGAMFYSQ